MKDNILLLKDLLEPSKKKPIYNYMTSISKNVYIDDIVNEYNKAYHRTIKMEPLDVKSGSYVKYNINSSDKDPKFQVCYHLIITKFENIFAKEYTSNWSE